MGFSWIVAFEPALSILESGPFETLSNYGFSPIPMFILMGAFSFKARMSTLLLTVPVVFPLIIEVGFDPIWFGIVAVIKVELGLITPPVRVVPMADTETSRSQG